MLSRIVRTRKVNRIMYTADCAHLPLNELEPLNIQRCIIRWRICWRFKQSLVRLLQYSCFLHSRARVRADDNLFIQVNKPDDDARLFYAETLNFSRRTVLRTDERCSPRASRIFLSITLAKRNWTVMEQSCASKCDHAPRRTYFAK